MIKDPKIHFKKENDLFNNVYKNKHYLGKLTSIPYPHQFHTYREKICSEFNGFGLWQELLEHPDMEGTDIIIQYDGEEYQASVEKFLKDGKLKHFNNNNEAKIYLAFDQFKLL